MMNVQTITIIAQLILIALTTMALTRASVIRDSVWMQTRTVMVCKGGGGELTCSVYVLFLNISSLNSFTLTFYFILVSFHHKFSSGI